MCYSKPACTSPPGLHLRRSAQRQPAYSFTSERTKPTGPRIPAPRRTEHVSRPAQVLPGAPQVAHKRCKFMCSGQARKCLSLRGLGLLDRLLPRSTRRCPMRHCYQLAQQLLSERIMRNEDASATLPYECQAKCMQAYCTVPRKSKTLFNARLNAHNSAQISLTVRVQQMHNA